MEGRLQKVRKFTPVIIIVVLVVVIIIINPIPLPFLKKSEGATNHQTNNRAGNGGGMAWTRLRAYRT